MNWSDLSMVNLQSKDDGTWSYTAYKKPFAMWRSNKGLPDVFMCIEELMQEIVWADDLEQAAAIHNILAKSTALDESIDASGGISANRQRVKKARRK